MAINALEFRKELYIEHLEEASFLYEHRLSLLTDPEVGWLDLEDTDDRLEAHLDALIVGGELALQLCRDHLEDADFSLLHVLVRVFCRRRSVQDFASIWPVLDFDDADKTQAVADALKWECPPQWQDPLTAVFKTDRLAIYPVIAPCVGYRGINIPEALSQALQRANHENQQIQIIRAMGRLGNEAFKPQLTRFLASPRQQVLAEAALALLRLGDASALIHCEPYIAKLPCLIAVGGKVSTIEKVHAIAQAGAADGDCLLALGLSGLPEFVQVLLNYLKHPDYASEAALALQLISGADLYKEVYAEERPDEDELFEDELADFKKGILPKNIDGLPYGVEIQQLTTDPLIWHQWFIQNKQRLQQGIRYRNGKPYSPEVLLEALVNNQTPTEVRQWTSEELVIRYAIKLTVEADDLVNVQKKKLNEIHRTLQQMQAKFEPGKWYFAGNPV